MEERYKNSIRELLFKPVNSGYEISSIDKLEDDPDYEYLVLFKNSKPTPFAKVKYDPKHKLMKVYMGYAELNMVCKNFFIWQKLIILPG